MPKKTRKTRQKELLKKEMKKFKSFFTAEDLYEKVSKVDSSIGIATVYRFLKSLREKKIIYSYRCEGRLVYSNEKKSHCHFVCQETGKIIHFDVDSLDFLKNKIPGEISSFQIEVKGVCNNCNTTSDYS